jgi:small subunit ribosomal protein S9
MSTQTTNATGRRKNAIAKVWAQPGTGNIVVNNRDFTDYFPSLSLQNDILRPLELSGSIHALDFKVSTNGGGVRGQAGALRLAISRILIELNPEVRPTLKKEGLLTRDPRMKERKKPGRPGARKRFQFSKR